MESNLLNIFVLSSESIEPDKADQTLANFLSIHDNSFAHFDLADRDDIDFLCSIEKSPVEDEICKQVECILKNVKKPLILNQNGNKPATSTASLKSKRDYLYEKQWQDSYQKLVQFHEEHGHCNVPRSWKTIGRWVHNQRMQYNNKRPNKLTPNRIILLEKLGFEWSGLKSTQNDWNQIWEKHFNELQQFYDTNGHYDVPKNSPLFIWVCKQKQLCRDFKRGKVTEFKKTRFETLKRLPNFERKNNSGHKKKQRLNSNTKKSIKARINTTADCKTDNQITLKYNTVEKKTNLENSGSEDIVINRNGGLEFDSQSSNSEPVLTNLNQCSTEIVSETAHEDPDVNNTLLRTTSVKEIGSKIQTTIDLAIPTDSLINEVNTTEHCDPNTRDNSKMIIDNTIHVPADDEMKTANDVNFGINDITNPLKRIKLGKSCDFEDLSNIRVESAAAKEIENSETPRNHDTNVTSIFDSGKSDIVYNDATPNENEKAHSNHDTKVTSIPNSSKRDNVHNNTAANDIQNSQAHCNHDTNIASISNSAKSDNASNDAETNDIENSQAHCKYNTNDLSISNSVKNDNVYNDVATKVIENLEAHCNHDTNVASISNLAKSNNSYNDRNIDVEIKNKEFELDTMLGRKQSSMHGTINVQYVQNIRDSYERLDHEFGLKARSFKKVRTQKERWQQFYKELVIFSNKFGHINVPNRIHLKNLKKLNMWLFRQKGKIDQIKKGKIVGPSYPHFIGLENIRLYLENKLRTLPLDYTTAGSNDLENNVRSWFNNSISDTSKVNENEKNEPDGTLNTSQHCREEKSNNSMCSKSFSNNKDQCWQIRFNDLVEYKTKHGHCNVPPIYEPNQPLATWVAQHRHRYHLKREGKETSLSESCFRSLEAIGFQGHDIHEQVWFDMYRRLENFSRTFGHFNVPDDFDKDKSLGLWANHQKLLCKKFRMGDKKCIAPHRLESLQKIGFETEPIKTGGEISYESSFNKYNSDQSAQTNNKCSSNALDIRSYSSQNFSNHDDDLCDAKYAKTIASKWDFRWQQRYDELVRFKNINGHCEVKGDRSILGQWVSNQRIAYQQNRLKPERIQALEKIGFRLKTRKQVRSNKRDNDAWQRRYEDLLVYHNLYGHCEVPQTCESLHEWVANQRTKYKQTKLPSQHIQALEKLGFRWQIKSNTKLQSLIFSSQKSQDDNTLAFM